MGLLDWLTEGTGSDMGIGGGGSPPMPPNMPMPDAAPPPMTPPPGPPPIPPLTFQRPEFAGGGSGPGMRIDRSQTFTPNPVPDPLTTDIGGGMQGGSSPPAPPTPMPMPRPSGAGMPPLPPPAAPGGGPGMPPEAPPLPPGEPLSLTPQAPGPSAASTDPFQRMLGGNADENKMKSMWGSLGAGLTAAGNSKGKSKGQAAFGGAGAAIEGGVKTDDKSYDQRLKALTLAVNAQRNGDTAAYNKNYAEYLKGKLESDTAKATPGGRSAWNKPDSQKFIDAQNALAKDPEVHASAKLLEQLSKTGDEAAIAKATAAHNALIQQKQGLYLTGVGLNPQTIQQNMKNPPGTPVNPHVVMNKQDFETYVKPGQAYKNPADGKIYIRNQGGQQKDDKEAPGGSPTAPAPPGPMPGTAAADAADDATADREEP